MIQIGKQIRKVSFGSLIGFVVGTAAAFAGETPPKNPLPSPLAKFKSQSDILHSTAAVRNALGDFFRGGAPIPASRVLGAVKGSDALMGALGQLHDVRYAKAEDATQIAVYNSDAMSALMRIDYGTCAGVATLAWSVNSLVAYDPDGTREYAAPKADVARLNEIRELVAKPSLTAEESAKVLAFYRPYVDRATIGLKFTVVPFFAAAQAWTAHPALFRAFQWRALELWFAKVSTFGGLFDMLTATNPKTARFGYGEAVALAKEARGYLERGIHPMVFIAAGGRSGSAKYIHVLQIWKVESIPAEGKLVFEVLDPNYGGAVRHQRITIEGVKEANRFAAAKVKAWHSDPRNWGPGRPLTEVEIVPWMGEYAARAGLSLLEATKKDPAGIELLGRDVPPPPAPVPAPSETPPPPPAG